MTSTGNQPAQTLIWITAPSLPYVDSFLLAIRWVALFGVAAISLFGGVQPQAFTSPFLVLPVVISYNALISILIWHHRPLGGKQAGWVLGADVCQAMLATLYTGGYASYYTFLFAIAIVEAAVAFYWQVALALTVSISMLQVIAIILSPTQTWTANSGPVTVAKFIILSTIGIVVTLFSERIRLEEEARREAGLAAARAVVLNEISVRLGECALEPARIAAIIADSVGKLPETVFSLVLVPDAQSNGGLWQVAASTTKRHPVGQRLAALDWDETGQQFFLAGAGYLRSLPNFVAADGITQLIGVRMILPAGNTLGIIMVGRQTGHPLNENEQLFLHSLALEAGLALRNAHLYSREQEQVERLRRFETLQATFFSATAHELKTPLTVLKTLVPTLRQHPDLPAQPRNEIVDAIEQNLSRLELLTTDLLESARLEAGAIELHLRPTNLANRARRVLDGLAPLLARKRLHGHLQSPPDLPRVRADGKRVEQILSNLVSNAAKFAPAGSSIQVQLSQVNAAVRVCVADAGPGVPPGERARIFNKFYIAVEDKALAGVGLGLFICRELVRLHEGRIWVEDRPGGGSCFCFTIPIAVEERAGDEESQL